MNQKEILELLDHEGIPYTYFEHPAVYTMEEMRLLNLPDSECVAVNLFLRDDKKRYYYLVTMSGRHKTDLKSMRHILGTRPLSFASENDLRKILGIEKGNVTPLAAVNDTDSRCETIIDIRFQNRKIGIHPMVNTAMVFMNGTDLFNLLQRAGHNVRWAAFEQIM